MGLLNKLKNTFFEEEYVEVDEEPTREERVAEKVEVEENNDDKKVVEEVLEEKVDTTLIDEDDEEEEEKPSYSDRDLVNKGNKLTYFDDEDFEPTVRLPKVVEPKEEKRIYGEVAGNVHNSINLNDLAKYNKPGHVAYGITGNNFQPTPIISPIYGVLDKNYRKEEVIDRKDKPSSYVSRKNADLDSIRKKAYGDVSLFGIEEEEKAKEEQEPLLYDMMEDNKPVVGEVTVGDAEEYFDDLGLEYNVDYKDEATIATGRRSSAHEEDNSLENVIINENFDNTSNEEEDEITLDDLINRNKEESNDDTEEDANLDDNLFDLVDSMYEGGE